MFFHRFLPNKAHPCLRGPQFYDNPFCCWTQHIHSNLLFKQSPLKLLTSVHFLLSFNCCKDIAVVDMNKCVIFQIKPIILELPKVIKFESLETNATLIRGFFTSSNDGNKPKMMFLAPTMRKSSRKTSTTMQWFPHLAHHGLLGLSRTNKHMTYT